MDQSTTPIWAKFFSELAALVLTGILATATVFLRKKILESLIKSIQHLMGWKIHTVGTIGQDEVRRDVRIQDMLAELRFTTKADRSYIFQFHNGVMFTNRNQMWKITCTHESVGNGIRSCIGELRDILSSSVSDLICPLWDGECGAGVTKISPDYCGCTGKGKCTSPSGVYFFDVNSLPEGYTKGLLISKAARYVVISPILDSEHNRVGFVGTDYCWDDENIEEVKKCSEKICKTASVISYELTKKGK